MKIRKHIITLIAVCLCGFGAMAQVDSGIDLQQMVQIPASPEAAGFQQYGNTNINMNLGKPNISVPIYVHQGREMQLPIILNYDASGIKTTQLATTTGLGWTLIAGGAVTRQKLGMADSEAIIGQKVNHTNVQNIIGISDNGGMGPGISTSSASNVAQLLSLQDDAEVMDADTQSDVFSFSVGGGVSGTVYIDYANSTAFCLEDPTIKVETTGPILNPTSWKITDTSGNSYEFSATETTGYTFDSGPNEFTSNYTSSWFLTKIISANGKDVYDFSYAFNTFWTITEDLHPLTSIQDRPDFTLGCSVINSLQVYSTPSSYKVNQRRLNTVTWNGELIAKMIYSAGRSDLDAGFQLDSVKISHGTDKLREVYFAYDDDYFGTGTEEKDKRLKLDSVVFRAATGIETGAIWAFEYYNPNDVPSRDTKGVDYWGYFNGKTNSSLVPGGSFSGSNFSGADRDPSITHTRYGSLKKIHFPTGGYEEFTYDQHQLDQTTKNVETLNTSSLGSITGGYDSNDPYSYNDDALGNAPKAITGVFTVNADTKDLTISFTGTHPNPLNENPDENVWLYIFPEVTSWNHQHAQNNAEIEKVYFLSNMGQSLPNVSLNLLADGDYRFLIYNATPGSTFSLSYRKLVTNTITYTPKIGGLRISKIESYVKDGKLASTRSYTYEEPEELQKLSFDGIKMQVNESNSNEYACLTYHRYSNNQLTPVGSAVAYNKVTQKNMDGTASNGYSVYRFEPHTFLTDRDVPHRMASLLNGRLKKVSVYNTNDALLQETESFYSELALPGLNSIKSMFFSSDTTVVGYRYRKTLSTNPATYTYDYLPWSDGGQTPVACSATGVNCEDDDGIKSLAKYNVRVYTLQPHFARLDSTVVTNYFDNSLSLSSKTSYSYNTTTHFQLTSQTSTDSEGSTWTTLNYYPDDVSSVSSLPGGNLEPDELTAINQMKTRHQINRVLQSQQLKNGSTLISRQRTNYGYWHSSSVQPESIETAKAGNTLETRIRFQDYFTDGNPQEVSQEGGNSIVYLWGYGGRYPVAKIENASYAQIEALSAFGLNFNLGIGGLSTQQETQLRGLPYALVTTMAFKPGVGMTSQTGPNGITTYYEYDSLGRLKLVKDNDGNILKMNEYEYQNQINTTGN